jgi:hypothetical protein
MTINLTKTLTDGLSSQRLTQVTPFRTSRRISLKVVDLMSAKLPRVSIYYLSNGQHSQGLAFVPKLNVPWVAILRMSGYC